MGIKIMNCFVLCSIFVIYIVQKLYPENKNNNEN